MYICFAEYRINPEHRESYLSYTQALLKDNDRVHIYEGTDQQHLFVELWSADTAEQAEQIKEERCSERSSWFQIADWIEGGAGKLHIWTFKPAFSSVPS
ncbi:hypothetical protein [Paenibacillus sp. YIM B09110]|uniref:hypothetical protein n=1 Tax=Paenibacillus sp. YIM B09110 TaxID=3126102 RepID=UPI00301BAF4E